MNSSGADHLQLAERVKKAAAGLPRGCIVTATRSGSDAPEITVAGQQEPKGVPPGKLIFEIGSISKVFTGMLLAQAVIDRKVTLESTLREVMGPKQSFADPRVAAITLRQLATHTSGLPRLPDDLDPDNIMDPYALYDRERLDACVARLKLTVAPPYRPAYSNLGAGLLGDILSRLYGESWERLVVDKIARPLGMMDTCVTLSAQQEKRLAPPYAADLPVKRWRFQALAGAGALYSTTEDLLRFGQALGAPEKTSIAGVIKMVEKPQPGTGTGLLLGISSGKDGTEYWYQGGTGGYGSWLSVNPATHVIVTMLINNGALSPEDVLFDKPPAKPAGPPDPALAVYAGRYDTGVQSGATDIHYTFEVRGSDLWMQITGQPFIKLSRHPTAKDRFEFKPVEAEIQFTRRKDEITSTTLFQSGLEIHAKKLPAQRKLER
jgi:CubicO group peptidase (beta-lactamase class C family)